MQRLAGLFLILALLGAQMLPALMTCCLNTQDGHTCSIAQADAASSCCCPDSATADADPATDCPIQQLVQLPDYQVLALSSPEQVSNQNTILLYHFQPVFGDLDNASPALACRPPDSFRQPLTAAPALHLINCVRLLI